MENPDFRPSNGHFRLPRLTEAWYVVCFSKELKNRPVRRTLLGMPIVLFRGEDGKAGALLDRCAHRNVPLSLGRVAKNQIECPYHGWQYDLSGNRVRVPGLCDRSGKKESLVPSFPTRDQDGLVWVYATPRAVPKIEPFHLSERDSDGYSTVHRVYEVEGSLFATIENALDVPHTAFLHRGLFRGKGEPQTIEAVINRSIDRVEVEWFKERPPKGLAARLLTSSQETMTHFDRFILPSITQVEYRLGKKGHLTTFFCTPVEDFLTRIFAVFQFRLGFPAWAVTLFMTPVIKRILAQDVEMVKRQTETVLHFGEERFTSTELDVMGLQIWQVLRRAELSPTIDASVDQVPGYEAHHKIQLRI
jgi:phenylpropionate dioxygenase-like ring-hydroxylating dioxygenase large terminal subunit